MLFESAVAAHRRGQPGQAEQILRVLVSRHADHADGFHLLGIIASQQGRHADAVELIGRSAALNERAAPYKLNLGINLRALGRAEEAAACFQAALRIRANYPEALNHLGTAFRDLDNPDGAETSFRAAIALKPDYADAFNNLGSLLRERGRLAEAQANYRQALALIPRQHPKALRYGCNFAAAAREAGRSTDAEGLYRAVLQADADDIEALEGLGLTLRDQGRLDEAIGVFEQLLRVAPQNPDACSHLGATLRVRGDLERSERWCRRALEIAPDHADALHSLGCVLLDRGRLDECRAHFERAIEINPGKAAYFYNIGSAKHWSREDPSFAALERLAAQGDGLPPGDRTELHFALGKAYDDIGERDRSFDHLLAGNALKRASIAYDEGATLESLQRIEAVFSRKLLETMQPTDKTSGPVFILGMPRSGSTLVEQILASHPRMVGTGEEDYLEQAIADVLPLASYPDAASDLSVAQREAIGASYRRRAGGKITAGSQTMRTADKLLRNFLYCGLIPLILPDARIIHTRRNPVDTCLSGFSKLFVGHHPYSYELGEFGRYYRAYERLMWHWHAVLPAGILIDVDYETLVKDQQGETRRILAHCGLPWDDACLAFHETDRPVRTASAMQVRQPLYNSSVGRWRPRNDLLKPLLDGLAGAAGKAVAISKNRFRRVVP